MNISSKHGDTIITNVEWVKIVFGWCLSHPYPPKKSAEIRDDHMSGGQNYLLLAMDMAKVGGPLSVAKVFTQT